MMMVMMVGREWVTLWCGSAEAKHTDPPSAHIGSYLPTLSS